jgi:predicted nucleic acid-binding protein
MSGGARKRVFADTNELIYAIDPLEKSKHSRAAEWISALWNPEVGRVSWQVLNEFYVNALRKVEGPPRAAWSRR